MPTQPTAFARTTKYYTNPAELQKAVFSLYRQFIRSAPAFAETYEINLPVAKIRTKLRQEFERNRFVQDTAINNVLYAKGQMEFQETINFWKQQCHVYKFFTETEEVKKKKIPDTFVNKFLHNSL